MKKLAAMNRKSVKVVNEIKRISLEEVSEKEKTLRIREIFYSMREKNKGLPPKKRVEFYEIEKIKDALVNFEHLPYETRLSFILPYQI